MNCPIRNVSCPEHGFVHGKEAEELREGIEAILRARDEDADESEDVLDDLRKLLDKVDARDSLAWREAEDKSAETKLDSVEQGWVSEIMQRCHVRSWPDGTAAMGISGTRQQVVLTVHDENLANACLQAVSELVELGVKRANSNRPSLADVTGYRVIAHREGKTEDQVYLLFGLPDRPDEDFVHLTMDRETMRGVISTSQSLIETQKDKG